MTPDQRQFVNSVELALAELGANQISFKLKGIQPVWQFDFSDGEYCWPLELCLAGWNFFRLPSVNWRTSLPVWGWPHISSSGDVCVSDREGLDYDPDNIVGVLDWLLAEVTRLLREYHGMSSRERFSLFADELEGYLKNLGARFAQLDAHLADDQSVYAEIYNQKLGLKFVPIVRRVNTGATALANCQQVRIGFLDITIHQLPPLTVELDANWWQQFLSCLDDSQYAIATSPKHRGLVLRVTNSYGHAFLTLYWGNRSHKEQWTATVYLLQRQDREYLIGRVGGTVLDRHVLVAGVGAIGARVAEHLALAGVSKLTLVDQDKFSADNLGRHVLGKDAISKNKVEELANFLAARMPGIEIVPKAMDIQSMLANGIPANVDLIVLATGNAPLERAIVRQAFQEKWNMLIVSTSVEAVGLGGHVIAMRPGTPGCLDCLYIDPETQQPISSMRTTLIESGQVVTRQLTGCGAFTPYSSIDATRTALIAAEHVINQTLGYSRWAGEVAEANKANIRPSDTYWSLRSQRIPAFLSPSDFTNQNCSCCSV